MTKTSGSPTRPLRFGVVAPITRDVATWREQLHRLADIGYSTLLMPDVPQWQPAPGPALAVAATITDLRVGTWVYASPVRPAWSTAWEAHSLSVLTNGRFEMGIGTGRPASPNSSESWACRSFPRANAWLSCATPSRLCGSLTARTGTPRLRWRWPAPRRKRLRLRSPTS